MATWFVSRHAGAIEWIKKQPVHIDRFVSHLDVNDIAEGDTVIGNVPLELAARICQKKAKLIGLTFSVSAGQRGKELTAQALNQLQCSLQEFRVESVR